MEYKKILNESRHRQEPLHPDRFVKISKREDRCDLPKSAWDIIFQRPLLQTHQGVLLLKDIMQVSLYPILLFEVKPKTIIELGAFNGGSAIWLADHLEMFHIKANIYSVDIDLSMLDDVVKRDTRIHFLQGDCSKISEIFSQKALSQFPHPWLIIEDSHINLIEVLEYFHENGLESGDYLIVEDTNTFLDTLDIWKTLGYSKKETKLTSKQKMQNLRKWMNNHHNEYLVDTYYLDMFGYNVSKNCNSIFKRV